MCAGEAKERDTRGRVTSEGERRSGGGRGRGGDRRSDRVGGGEMSITGGDFSGVGEDPRIFRNICRDRTHPPPLLSIASLSLLLLYLLGWPPH